MSSPEFDQRLEDGRPFGGRHRLCAVLGCESPCSTSESLDILIAAVGNPERFLHSRAQVFDLLFNLNE